MKTLLEFKREAVDAACSHEGIRCLLMEGGHFEVVGYSQDVEIRLALYRGEIWCKSSVRFDFYSYERHAFREIFWNGGIDAALRKLSEVSAPSTISR